MVEWVLIHERDDVDVAVVTSETGKAWLHKVDETTRRPFGEPMQGKLESTGALLNACVAFGFGDEVWVKPLTRWGYILDLVSAYHNATRSPGHFRHAAGTLRRRGRPDLAEFLEHHAVEETGHDKFVVKDLNALGLDGQAIVNRLVPPGIASVVALFDSMLNLEYPVDMIGYSYAFESVANMKGPKEVAAIRELLPEGIDCTRFLRTHSALGSEAQHVEDLVEFIAGLSAPDRTLIAQAAYRATRLLSTGMTAHKGLDDAAIEAMIAA